MINIFDFFIMRECGNFEIYKNNGNETTTNT